MAQHNLDGVVLHGSSGVWLGAALMMHDALPEGTGLVLVRKAGENSHGALVEGANDTACHRLLMLDDFVSSGESVRRVQRTLVEEKVNPAYVFAVLQHDRMYSHKDYEKPSSTMMHGEGQCLIY